MNIEIYNLCHRTTGNTVLKWLTFLHLTINQHFQHISIGKSAVSYSVCVCVCVCVLLHSSIVRQRKAWPYSYTTHTWVANTHTTPVSTLWIHIRGPSTFHLVPTLPIKEHPDWSIPLFLQDRVVARAFFIGHCHGDGGRQQGRCKYRVGMNRERERILKNEWSKIGL